MIINREAHALHLTMIFIDGFGLGANNQHNPIVQAKTPNLDELLGGRFLYANQVCIIGQTFLYPLDPTLGVPGIPQSATGQAALWTGVNAAKILGYHLNSYPNELLTQIINEYSIFKQLAAKGKKVTFANAFTKNYEEMVLRGTKRHSASTLSALAGEVRLRHREELLEGKAVYQDITNEIFQKRGEDVPLIRPEEAGRNLAAISREYDFTLFEYFQTDVRGHRKNMAEAIHVIENLDEFIGGFLAVVKALDPNKEKMALIITSDHGNIEDLSTPAHTLNHVPAICWSNYGQDWPVLEKIEDVTPMIVNLLNKSKSEEN